MASAVKFAELHRRLAQQPGLKSRWAVLHALLQVSEDRRAEDHAVVPAGGGIGAGAATARHIADPLSSTAAAGGLPSLSDPDPRSLAANDGSTLGLDHPGSRALAYRELNAEAEANLEIGEQELVRDVLFACQGIDGKHVRYNRQMASYVVDPAAPVRPGARDLARKLTELGWLFRRVRAALGGADEVSGGTHGGQVGATPSLGNIEGMGGDGGCVRQAFRAAVQAELADYYRLIAVLEAQAQVPMASALEGGAVDGNGKVTERVLGDHVAGIVLNASIKVMSHTVADGKRTVVLNRPLRGLTPQHHDFDSQQLSLDFISAVGSGSTFGYHKAKTASTISLWPRTPAASKGGTFGFFRDNVATTGRMRNDWNGEVGTG